MLHFIVTFLLIPINSPARAETDILISQKTAEMGFIFTAENINLKRKIKFNKNNGQFEVYILKEKFPIPAPNCKSDIIARMPASVRKNQNEIDLKRSLFESIQQLNYDKSKAVPVKLNLKPYLKIHQLQPFQGELQFCNVFFMAP